MVSVEEQSRAAIGSHSDDADIAGIISSIIGVAGAGFRLSLILNAVSCEVASEGLEVHSISKAVTLFALTLKQVGISLQNADSVHTFEALDGVHKISEDATDVFDEFNEMLDKVRSRPQEGRPVPSIQQRFQWCFKKHRVSYLMGQLETLKMNASLIQQVLALGKLMASTNKGDSTEEVQMKQELIRQERAETQNVLIVRYWQMSKMDRLYEASRLEDEDHKIAAIEQDDEELALVSSNAQLAIEAPPPEYSSSLALTKLSAYSLGELDQDLHKIRRSPKDMVQVSENVIEPLLDRWTRWYEVREQRHRARERESKPQNRYVPTVDNLQEDDDDGMHPYHRRYDNIDQVSPRAQAKGFFLEGSTTDWRQPHSVEARSNYARRKKEYKRYQPSVSADNSDGDNRDLSSNSPGSRRDRKKAPRHHIIDSSSESDISDHEPQAAHPRQRRDRRSSDSPKMDRPHPIMSHAYTATPTPRNSVPTISNGGAQGRPHPHHAYTAPGPGIPYPPINVANAHNPYSTTTPPSQGAPVLYGPQPTPPITPQQYPAYPQLSNAHARYMPAAAPGPPAGSQMANPNRMSVPNIAPPYVPSQGRPVSRDGPPHSPSRPQYPTSQPPGSRSGSYRDNYHRPWSPAPGRDGKQAADEKEKEKPNAKKNLREGATKGLLGAGAIGGFLEMLEGLSI